MLKKYVSLDQSDMPFYLLDECTFILGYFGSFRYVLLAIQIRQ